MSSYAESIVKPLFSVYIQAIDDQKWDVVEEFYHKNGVIIQRNGDNKDFFGNKAIAKIIENAFLITGKTVNSIFNDTYTGSGDYLVLTANYKTETEKVGTITGEFLQVWKKTGDKWNIYHDEYTVDNQ